MFYHLDGKVAELGQGMAVIDCSGVGYLVNVSLNTLAQLKNGERAKLYISESVREDAFELFGFASKSEKRSFDLLIGVSGVGPKAALSILSAHTPEALSMAILSGDEKALTVAPGIGKKIAQRVILELKDKLGTDGLAEGMQEVAAQLRSETTNMSEAVSALCVLGYSQSEAARALAGMAADTPVDELIKHGLKALSGGR